jgi:hypothetical protein
LPTTGSQWVTLILTTAGGTALVWVKSNHPSVFAAENQIEAAPTRIASIDQVK